MRPRQLVEKIGLTTVLRAKIRENARIAEKYEFEESGLRFVGYPNVFAPPIFPSFALWPRMPVHSGESMLEIGSGTGIYSIVAARDGASRVVAVDINPDAVANTVANTVLHGVEDRVTAYVSDIFNAVPFGERFDVVAWNIPWCHVEQQRELSMLERSVFDPGLALLRRYLQQGARVLRPDGRLLLGYSRTHGEPEAMLSIAHQFGWSVRLFSHNNDGDISGDLYELRS